MSAGPLGPTGPIGGSGGVGDPPTTRPRRRAARPLFGGRYRATAIIGEGGFSVIWAAFDEEMREEVVVKAVDLGDPDARAVAERLLTAPQLENRLDHPCIVPITHRGRDGDTLWLVMERIDGGTFTDLIAALHPSRDSVAIRTRQLTERLNATGEPSSRAESSSPPEDRPVEAWLNDMEHTLELLVQAARALGFAHRQGVVHRDIKPDNLMRGARRGDDGRQHEAARVIDWALAVRIGAPPAERQEADGTVIGTRGYLAPERRDPRAPIAPTSDVYALGAVLYHVLAGHPPPESPASPRCEALDVAAFAPEWVAVAADALADDPAARPPDGDAFAEALTAALETARLRRTAQHRLSARRSREAADDARARAAAILGDLQPWDDPELRTPAWRLEEQAARFEHAADVRLARWLEGVEHILRRVPDLVEAHLALAEHAAEQLRACDALHDRHQDQLLATRLRRSCADARDALEARRRRGIPMRPEAHAALRAKLADFETLLDGPARLTLVTDPPGLPVYHRPIHLELKRLVPTGERRLLGHTPLDAVEVERGAGLVEIEADSRTIAYPIAIGRATHWTGVRPGDARPRPLPMPPRVRLGPRDAYVPAGWARVGGDPRAVDAIGARRVWVDGFVMRVDPVTWAEYLEFLDDLAAHGRFAELDARLPHLAPPGGARAALPSPRNPADIRRHIDASLPLDDAALRTPVFCVDWFSAVEYTRWYARRAGLPWRLACQWEYEKAARGVDGRRLPWGDHMEPRWTRIINTTRHAATRAPVDADTRDVSVHGIRWLAGNMRTWCLDVWTPDGPPPGSVVRIPPVDFDDERLRIGRGGAFCDPGDTTSAASRYADRPRLHLTSLGIRLARSLTPAEEPES